VAQPDIFLSYNREDADVARRFAEGFEAQGFDVWWDQALRSGETYDEVTEAALRGAKAVVVLWSPRSVVSRWVRAEATIGERNRTLVPAKIEPCDLPVMFELTQTADLSGWQGDAGDRAWLAFLSDARRMVGVEVVETVPTAATSTAGAGIPIVAVLPITHRGGGEEMDFLAEDLSEEIARELSHDSFFEVTAVGAMAVEPGKQVDYRKLGREIGASYFVQAKLQLGGDTVRLTAQIIDAAASKMLWTKKFTVKADEITDTPEEFAATIASELGEQILQVESARAIAKPGPYSAWENIVRGVAYQARLGSDSGQRVIEEGRQAVAAAPDLALAHTMLANGLANEHEVEGNELGETAIREIRTHAKRALQLGGDDPVVVGWLSRSYSSLGDVETSLRLARRMVELCPNSPRSYFVLGAALLHLGRISEAIAAFERQDDLSSHDMVRYLGHCQRGICHALEGRLSEAVEALDRSLALHPEYHNTLKWKAIVSSQRGDEEDALATTRRLREAEPDKSIEQHVRQVMSYNAIADRLAEPIATLRRLWEETEAST